MDTLADGDDPGPARGEELEFGATIRTSDPTLGKNDAGLLVLAPEPTPGRFHLRLSWDEGHKPSIKMSQHMTAVAQQNVEAVDYRFDNPPAVTPAKDSPPPFLSQRMTGRYSAMGERASGQLRYCRATPSTGTRSRLGFFLATGAHRWRNRGAALADGRCALPSPSRSADFKARPT
jgi:hypothetical protein